MKPNTLIKKRAGQSSNQDPNPHIRSKRLELRMSEDEFISFEKKFMETSFNSMASYARELILSHCIVHPTTSKEQIQEIKKFRLAMNKIGVNINQIARNLNGRKKEMLSVGMVDDLRLVRQALLKVVEHFNHVTKSEK
jgi:hypothetical protein